MPPKVPKLKSNSKKIKKQPKIQEKEKAISVSSLSVIKSESEEQDSDTAQIMIGPLSIR
jgi:hypothetical protein